VPPQILLLKETIDLELLNGRTREFLMSNPVQKGVQAFVSQTTDDSMSLKFQYRDGKFLHGICPHLLK
jgi:hypothetical protein